MKLRILTLPFDSDLGRFDDEHLRQFLADKVLLEVRDHFFAYQDLPHLALVVTYGTNTGLLEAPAAKKAAARPKRKEDWRDILRPGDMPLFNTIREWRSQRAKEDGVPPYVICNNRQLAKIVRDRPQTLAKLAEAEGFGAAKLKHYGAAMLSLLRVATEEPHAKGEEEGEASDGG